MTELIYEMLMEDLDETRAPGFECQESLANVHLNAIIPDKSVMQKIVDAKAAFEPHAHDSDETWTKKHFKECPWGLAWDVSPRGKHPSIDLALQYFLCAQLLDWQDLIDQLKRTLKQTYKLDANDITTVVDTWNNNMTQILNDMNSIVPTETESLNEASNLSPEQKMDDWHRGVRKENIRACGAPKLDLYHNICIKKGYWHEARELEYEAQRRGISLSGPTAAQAQQSQQMFKQQSQPIPQQPQAQAATQSAARVKYGWPNVFKVSADLITDEVFRVVLTKEPRDIIQWCMLHNGTQLHLVLCLLAAMALGETAKMEEIKKFLTINCHMPIDELKAFVDEAINDDAVVQAISDCAAKDLTTESLHEGQLVRYRGLDVKACMPDKTMAEEVATLHRFAGHDKIARQRFLAKYSYQYAKLFQALAVALLLDFDELVTDIKKELKARGADPDDVSQVEASSWTPNAGILTQMVDDAKNMAQAATNPTLPKKMYRVVLYDGNYNPPARRHIYITKTRANGVRTVALGSSQMNGHSWYDEPLFDSPQQAQNFINNIKTNLQTRADKSKIYGNVTDKPIDRMVYDLDDATLVNTDLGPAYIHNKNNKINEDIEKHDELNPKLFNEDGMLKDEVREKVEEIVTDFTGTLAEDGIKIAIDDVILIGSNVSYNYTKDSDLDIHIIANTKDTNCPDNLYPKLYSAYRSLYNKSHDIEFYGVPVEIYVETEDSARKSNGEYSVRNNKWNKEPVKEDIPEIDMDELDALVKPFMDRYEEVKANPTIEAIDKLIADIYAERQEGLKASEYDLKALTFKEFRNSGALDDLKELRNETDSTELSLEHLNTAALHEDNAGTETVSSTTKAANTRMSHTNLSNWKLSDSENQLLKILYLASQGTTGRNASMAKSDIICHHLNDDRGDNIISNNGRSKVKNSELSNIIFIKGSEEYKKRAKANGATNQRAANGIHQLLHLMELYDIDDPEEFKKLLDSTSFVQISDPAELLKQTISKLTGFLEKHKTEFVNQYTKANAKGLSMKASSYGQEQVIQSILKKFIAYIRNGEGKVPNEKAATTEVDYNVVLQNMKKQSDRQTTPDNNTETTGSQELDNSVQKTEVAAEQAKDTFRNFTGYIKKWLETNSTATPVNSSYTRCINNTSGLTEAIDRHVREEARIKIAQVTHSQPQIQDNGRFHIYNINERDLSNVMMKLRNLDFIDQHYLTYVAGKFDFSHFNGIGTPPRVYNITGLIDFTSVDYEVIKGKKKELVPLEDEEPEETEEKDQEEGQ